MDLLALLQHSNSPSGSLTVMEQYEVTKLSRYSPQAECTRSRLMMSPSSCNPHHWQPVSSFLNVMCEIWSRQG
jgi:hypothetical protein